MSNLIAIVFKDEETAEAARTKVLQMQKSYMIELADAVVAVRRDNAHVKLNQMINTTGTGAASGGFWGLLVGVLFMMPLAGAALGAASGALLGALTDVGINDGFMRGIAENVPEGAAVLFLMTGTTTPEKITEDLAGLGGTVLRTSFDRTRENALREALSAGR